MPDAFLHVCREQGLCALCQGMLRIEAAAKLGQYLTKRIERAPSFH